MNKTRALFDHSRGISALLNNTDLSTQLLLDATHPDIESVLQPSPHQRNVLELKSRELIYKLHVNRTRLLLADLNNQRANREVVPYVNNCEKNWPLIVLNFYYMIILWTFYVLTNLRRGHVKSSWGHYKEERKEERKMASTAAILKIYFELLLLNRNANWLETW